MYSQIPVESGVGDIKLKVPTQHKNSESILLPISHINRNSDGTLTNNDKIRGLYDAMVSNDIDVVMFKTAVKVGATKVVDINNMSASQIRQKLSDIDIHQTTSYEDYKIQQAVPNHLQDSNSLFGSQIRTLIFMDIDPNTMLDYKGQPIRAGELKKKYNDLITENIISSLESLLEEFGSIESLQKIIADEIINNDRYDADLLNAIRLVEKNGRKQFAIPLLDPSQSTRIQQLLNSI